jgi:phosphoribosylanthranilate isomerase
MSTPFIQIAGIKNVEDVETLVNSGVKYVGFPLRLGYHMQDITEEDAKKLIEQLPTDVNPVLITYESNANEIVNLLKYLNCNIVQVHGEIEISELLKIKQLSPESIVIKSIIINANNKNDAINQVKQYSDKVDFLITDTYDEETGACGATGKTHDWNTSREVVKKSKCPVIIAGGLDANNVIEAILTTNSFGVDSHTGVEDNYGYKDINKVSRFVKNSIKALQRHTLSLPKLLTIGSLDGKVFLEGELIYKSDLLEIDMSNVEYASLDALTYILSIIDKRCDNSTYFKLPNSKQVRDFMKVWDFDGAIKQNFGFDFKEMCLSSEYNTYINENKYDEDWSYKVRSKKQDQLITSNFFSFCTYHMDEYLSKDSKFMPANLESSKWDQELIQEVLHNLLNDRKNLPPSYVPSRIVYEAMTNAIRHPNAGVINSVSRFTKGVKGKIPQSINLVYWDNGTHTHKTLKNALYEKDVQIKVDDKEHIRFNLTYRGKDNKAKKEVIESTEVVTREFSDYKLFLACFFPGVSCDLERKTYLGLPDGDKDTGAGKGLTALLNCSCHIFKGAAVFRSGDYYARFTQSNNGDSNEYDVAIKDFGNDTTSFKGNLVTVELPFNI